MITLLARAIAIIALAWAILPSLAAATTHVVKKGETLSQIASTYGVTIELLEEVNNLRDADKIQVGQRLEIPSATIEYKIRKGDNLSDIAAKHGVNARELARLNGIRNPNRIRSGQVIRIPRVAGRIHPQLPSSVERTLERISPRRGAWKYIVIHHSANNSDTPKSIDRYHREERHMENGMAYHFVIGNGVKMTDGEIHVGHRWKNQIQGGHLRSADLNEVSIGICLVGNFERTRPTDKQMESLEALVTYLMKQAGISKANVTTHTLIHRNHTKCPGRYFPTSSFRAKL